MSVREWAKLAINGGARMTNAELEQLWKTSNARIRELEAKYRAGLQITRQDCIELRTCNKRLRTVAYESWLQAGRPDDPVFDDLRDPPPERPFPWTQRPLDLTERTEGGVN